MKHIIIYIWLSNLIWFFIAKDFSSACFLWASLGSQLILLIFLIPPGYLIHVSAYGHGSCSINPPLQRDATTQMYDSINHWIAALYVDNCAWHIGDDKWMCTMICICVRSHLQTPLGHPPSYRSCFGHVPLPWSKQSCKTLDRLFPKRLHYQPRVHHHFKLIGDYSLKTQWTRPPTVVWCKEWKEWMPHSTASAAEAGWNGCKNSPATGHIQ